MPRISTQEKYSIETWLGVVYGVVYQGSLVCKLEISLSKTNGLYVAVVCAMMGKRWSHLAASAAVLL